MENGIQRHCYQPRFSFGIQDLRQKAKMKPPWNIEILLIEEMPPVDMGNIPLFIGFYASKRWLWMGFLNHQPYLSNLQVKNCRCLISLHQPWSWSSSLAVVSLRPRLSKKDDVVAVNVGGGCMLACLFGPGGGGNRCNSFLYILVVISDGSFIFYHFGRNQTWWKYMVTTWGISALNRALFGESVM